MTPLELLVALAIAVGVVGVLVPVLPAGLLVGAAVLVWAVDGGTGRHWLVLALVLGLLLAGAVVKYAVPGRHLTRAGIPARTQVVGVLLGVVGFFVIPVLGAFIGFVLGIYLAERARLGPVAGWPSTKQALRAAGLSVLIELTATVLAAATWVVGVIVT